MLELHSIVQLKTDLPEFGLKTGAEGTIVMIYESRKKAIVEFSTEKGLVTSTIPFVHLAPCEISKDSGVQTISRDHLGGGVNAGLTSNGDVVITKENECGPTDTVIMERSVVRAFLAYLERVKGS